MKKCVKCKRKYDDSILVCPTCGLYLIADVVSDLEIDHTQTDLTTTPPTGTSGRRRRVVPVEEPVISGEHVPQINNSSGSGGFEPSNEPAIDCGNDESVPYPVPRRSSDYWYNIRRFIRRYYPIIRIIVAIILLVIAAIWISANRESVSAFLQCCIIGGIVGGGLLSFLSIRYGRYFNIDVVAVGTLGGMVIGCLLNYNIFNTAIGLSEFFNGIGPCIITIIGIYIATRGVFRR